MRTAETIMEKLQDVCWIVFFVVVSILVGIVRFTFFLPLSLFTRYVFDPAAPFRSVRGPYILVLRSFANTMATTRRITRVVFGQDGQPVETPDFVARMPDLTVIQFLREVSALTGSSLVGVSNGTSLNGSLKMVYSPEGKWFDAVKALAAHARAIIVIPDATESLAREISYVERCFSEKAALLMPPSMSGSKLVSEELKYFLIEGVDLSGAWTDAQTTSMVLALKSQTTIHLGGSLSGTQARRHLRRYIHGWQAR